MISNKIYCPLPTKLRIIKLFKMFFQVDFSTKNVQRFSFELLVALKLKKRGVVIMASPWVSTSFQSLGKIGLYETVLFQIFTAWKKCFTMGKSDNNARFRGAKLQGFIVFHLTFLIKKQ